MLAEVAPAAPFVSPPLLEYFPHASPPRRSPARVATRGHAFGRPAERDDAWVAVGYAGGGGGGGGGGAWLLPEGEEGYQHVSEELAELRAQAAALQWDLSQEVATPPLGAGGAVPLHGPAGHRYGGVGGFPEGLTSACACASSSGDNSLDDFGHCGNDHRGELDSAMSGGTTPWDCEYDFDRRTGDWGAQTRRYY